jgi:HTH-type transcriptional regulator/antitoxin HigA
MDMDIKPIRTENDYIEALAQIDSIFDAEPGTPEGDLLEVLTILVEAYEEEHYPIAPPDPIEAIEYHMERLGLTRRDIEPYIGSRARVSEILNRRRPLTLSMIRRLQDGLGISAEILLQRYPLADEGSHTFMQDYADDEDIFQIIKNLGATVQLVGSSLDLLKMTIQVFKNTDAGEATSTVRSSATQPGYYPFSIASIPNRQERILQ